MAGIKLVDATSGRPSSPPRLTVSSGIRPASAKVTLSRYRTDSTFSYEPNAIVADADWRCATAAEHDLLCGSPVPADGRSWMAVVTIPEQVLDAFHPTINELRRVRELTRANDLFSRTPGIRAALAYASSFVDQSDGLAWPKGVRVNPPGLPTVTVDSRSNRLVGMHVDNWVNSPLAERNSSPNRVGMNLGIEDRYFVYINLPLTRVWDLVNDPARVELQTFEPDLIANFARRYARYPATRLRIAPGEAYIAPTDNIIHDGSTAGMTEWDLYLTTVGYFASPDVNRDGFVRQYGIGS